MVVPPRAVCPYCGPRAGDLEQTEVAASGTVLSHTVSYFPPEGFTAPLMLALVRLDAGATILCLVGPARDRPQLHIGSRVHISVDESGRFVATCTQDGTGGLP